MSVKKLPDYAIKAFCFWEIHKIGINVLDPSRINNSITSSGALVDCYDISIEHAKELQKTLELAIECFEIYEKGAKEDGEI
jgi:hypothetical protein